MDNQAVREKYNKDIVEKFGSDYEQNRWFKNEFTKSGYDAMFATIQELAASIPFSSCLELGPGHGTWTNVLLENHKSAHFDLVDISSEMLRLAKERFSRKDNISYHESDFLEFSPAKKYDFFFSSRALEYIDDKPAAIKKIISLLAEGGTAFIITKTPKYLRMKLMGKKVSAFHSGQISPRLLKALLMEAGASEVELYPVTFVWPFWRSAQMNRFLFRLLGRKKLCPLKQFFSESYAVRFKKI
jgi:ubiquinone/menaquinone biosynthesis C-methylase UbiE